MPQPSGSTNKPSVIINPFFFFIGRKNVLLALLFGTAIIGAGLAGYYYFQLKAVKAPPPVSPPKTATSSTQKDETAGWKSYISKDGSCSFKHPSTWTQKPIQILGSRSIQEIEDPQGRYSFSFTTQGNYNNGTGKPYADLYEYVNLPYTVKTVTIGGQEAIQPLPRAGSENSNAVYFFSTDFKRILILELETHSQDEKEVLEGQQLFTQILSTFKFLSSTSSE
jgi:hypothetical protein